MKVSWNTIRRFTFLPDDECINLRTVANEKCFCILLILNYYCLPLMASPNFETLLFSTDLEANTGQDASRRFPIPAPIPLERGQVCSQDWKTVLCALLLRDCSRSSSRDRDSHLPR